MRGDMDQPVAQSESPLETGRRMENMVAPGVIEQVRTEAPARCRVRVGGNLTEWLPWFTLRAAGEAGNFWWPPSPGEQVVVLAPGGDLARGFVLMGAYSDAMPQRGDQPGTMEMWWNQSDHLRYGAGVFTIQILETSIKVTPDHIEMKAAGGTLRLDGEGLTVSPEVKVGPIKLTEHKHTGVITGPMVSGEPVP